MNRAVIKIIGYYQSTYKHFHSKYITNSPNFFLYDHLLLLVLCRTSRKTFLFLFNMYLFYTQQSQPIKRSLNLHIILHLCNLKACSLISLYFLFLKYSLKIFKNFYTLNQPSNVLNVKRNCVSNKITEY